MTTVTVKEIQYLVELAMALARNENRYKKCTDCFARVVPILEEEMRC